MTSPVRCNLRLEPVGRQGSGDKVTLYIQTSTSSRLTKTLEGGRFTPRVGVALLIRAAACHLWSARPVMFGVEKIPVKDPVFGRVLCRDKSWNDIMPTIS